MVASHKQIFKRLWHALTVMDAHNGIQAARVYIGLLIMPKADRQMMLLFIDEISKRIGEGNAAVRIEVLGIKQEDLG